MAFLSILILSGALALACFIVGNLPLSFSFSKLRIAQLSTLGVGLLLGAALGIIIPEGVEAIFSSISSSSHSSPAQITALTLLSGFILMLLVEQLLLPPEDHSGNEYSLVSNSEAGRSSSNLHNRTDSIGNNNAAIEANQRKARSITIGLVIHSLADGLALGASSFSSSMKSGTHSHARRLLNPHPHSQGKISDEIQSNHLTLIVFLALLIHKLPTALALSTSLLPLIPTHRIRFYIGVFAMATPIGALLCFILLGLFDTELLGVGDGGNKLLAGIALTFSGGTFLYVATVLQPVRSDPSSTSEGEEATNGRPSGGHRHVHPGEGEWQQVGPKMRVAIICIGMIIPVTVSTLIGHGHG